MSRNAWIVVLGLLAAIAAAFFLLGGPNALFGSGDGGRSDSSSASPDPAAAAGVDDSSAGGVGAAGGKKAVLFGRKRADLKGVGGLRARVLHYGDNKPVVGVRLILQGTGYGGEAVAADALTDANGRGAFDGIAAGDSYRLEVRAEHEAPLFFPDVQVPSRSTTELPTIYLGARGVLEGRVVDERGEGIASADVRVFSGRGNMAQILENFGDLFANLDRDPKPLAQGTAAKDGRFRIEDVAPGSLTIRGTAPGRVRKMVSGEMTPQGLAGGAITIVLSGGADVAGRVVDEAGRGIGGARLAVMNENAGDPFEFIYGRVFADADAKGDFRVTVDPSSKRHRAIVAAEGYPTTVSKRFDAGEVDLRIVLHGGATARVSVKEKETGRPIEGAQVMIVVADGKRSEDGDEGAMAFGVTDASGVTTLVTRAGKLEMGMVNAPGHAAAMLSGDERVGSAMPGVVEGNYPKEMKAGTENLFDLRLPTGVTLVGKVLDPSGGPIADAELKPLAFFGGGGASVARSGPDGAYRLEGVSANEMGIVRVRATGWSQRQDDMQLKLEKGSSGEVKHDFTLHKSATVRGRVVDSTSQPVAGAKVTFRGASGGGFGIATMLGDMSAITAADGTYVLYDVDQNSSSGMDMMMTGRAEDGSAVEREPPKSTVRVTAAGYVEGRSAGFPVPEGATVDAPLVTLTRGARITGVVLDPRGSPMPHARLEASFKRDDDPKGGFDFDSLMEQAHTVLAGEDGRFAIETVPAGTATLTANADGVSPTRKTVKVAADQPPAPVEIKMRLALEVRGRVLDPERRGLAGARVSVEDRGSDESDDAYFEPVQARTDAEGQFVLKPLPPMRVKVAVAAEGFARSSQQVDVGGPPFDVNLAKKNPDAAKRLVEIDAELKEIYKQFSDVKGNAERQALAGRMMELNKEKQELQGEGTAESATPAPADTPPPR